ncbi:MAG: hypothetical protein AAF512_24190, partial [Pseudomonadota bacterium]
SDDGGASWTQRSGTIPNDVVVRKVTSVPNNAQLVYAATSSTNRRGIFRSFDGGLTWFAVNNGLTTDGGTTTLNVFALVIDPTTTTTLYAGTTTGGVFKTTNNGNNWVAMNAGLTDMNVPALLIDPMETQTVYAGTQSSGIFKSTDGGANWTAASNGLPVSENVEIISLTIDAVDMNNVKTLYASTEKHGVFESKDGGNNWVQVNLGLAPPFMCNIAVDPQNDLVFTGSVIQGLAKGTPNQQPTDNGSGEQSLTTIAEDMTDPAGDTISTIFSSRFQDGDDVFAGVAIVENAMSAGSGGTWEYSTDSGSNWMPLGSPQDSDALILAPQHLLRFTPVNDFNGMVSNVNVRLWDGSDQAIAGTRNDISSQLTGSNGAYSAGRVEALINVLPVNDAPIFSSAGDQQHANGEMGNQMVSNWASMIVLGAPMSDEAAQMVQGFSVMLQADASSILSGLPSVDNNGNLSYTLTGNAGEATLEVRLQDDGGTSDGGADTSTPTQLKITVSPPANVPILPQDGSLANVPPETFQNLGAQELGGLSEDRVRTLNAAQWQNIPDASLSGLTRSQLGILPLDILDVVTADDLANLSTTEITQSDSLDISRFLTNLNTQLVNPENVSNLLPDGWSIDLMSGALTAPANAKIAIRAVPPLSNPPANLTLPAEQPDLNSSFGLGGQGGPSLLEGLNSALDAVGLPDFEFVQNNGDGVLTVIDPNDMSGLALSFIPDATRLLQTDGPNNTISVLPGDQFVPIT